MRLAGIPPTPGLKRLWQWFRGRTLAKLVVAALIGLAVLAGVGYGGYVMFLVPQPEAPTLEPTPLPEPEPVPPVPIPIPEPEPVPPVPIPNPEPEPEPPGKLEHVIPREMEEQETKTAYVRISRDAEAQLFEQLPEDAKLEGHEIDVGSSMIVDLKASPASAFVVTALTEREQLLPTKGFAHWEWDLVSDFVGDHELILSVTLVVKDTFGNKDRATIEVFRQKVKVTVLSVPKRALRFVEEQWQWIIATIVAILGLVLAYRQFVSSRKLLPQTTKQIEREDYDRLKGLIGQSMLCGRMLYTMNQPDREKAKTLVGKWKAATCNLITAGLGQGENWRFLSDDGIVTYSGKKDAIDIDVERRLIRLNEIMQSISPDKCSPSFDPKNWEDQFNLNEFT